MMVKRIGFGKAEKLKSRKSIDALFSEGKSLTVSPIRLTYRLISPAEVPCVKAGVTASKKSFRKAVDRNRIKRILREAYRLQKESLHRKAKEKNIELHIFLLYNGNNLPAFTEICRSMKTALQKLEEKLEA
jgi:ribonuclease P protein component